MDPSPLSRSVPFISLDTKSPIVGVPALGFGDTGGGFVWGGKPGDPMFSIGGDELILENRDGRLLVTVTVRDHTGKLLAKLDESVWQVFGNQTCDRNYTNDSLEVLDAHGDVVLQARLVKDGIQFQGKLYDRAGNGFCFLGVRGGIFAPYLSKSEMDKYEIEPMFKYPSKLHLGEK